jgi:hypothetical protein
MRCRGLGCVGMGCAQCGGGCGCLKSSGMGNIDFSTFTWEDWFIVGILGMSVYYLAKPDSAAFTGKRKKRRKKSSGGSTLNTLVTTGLVLGGAYLAYQVWQTGQAFGEGLALPTTPSSTGGGSGA